MKTKEELQSELGFCGCGRPEENLIYIAKGLQLIKDRYETSNYCDISKFFGSTDSEFFFYYVMDILNFVDHGSSIRSGWLTDKGENFLKSVMELYPEEFK